MRKGMHSRDTVTKEAFEKAITLKSKKSDWKDPLAELMKQLGLKPEVDIDTVALPESSDRLQNLGDYDKRGVTSLSQGIPYL